MNADTKRFRTAPQADGTFAIFDWGSAVVRMAVPPSALGADRGHAELVCDAMNSPPLLTQVAATVQRKPRYEVVRECGAYRVWDGDANITVVGREAIGDNPDLAKAVKDAFNKFPGPVAF